MTVGSYMVFAGAWRGAYGTMPWSGYVTKSFTYAQSTTSTSPEASPTSSASPLACAPVSQTVALGQAARVTAAGGAGNYRWSATQNGGSANVVANGASATIRFTIAGSHEVRVSSGGNSVTCQVDVQEVSVGNSLTIDVSGRNATTSGPEGDPVEIRTGQQVEISAIVRNESPDANIQQISVRAELPEGLSYVSGSTRVAPNVTGATARTANDGITSNGISLGSLTSNTGYRVTFRAIPVASRFPVGTTEVQSVVRATAPGAADASDGVVINVVRSTGSTTGVTQVQTGPGEALLAAFLVSAIMTLLYVSYTHSSSYKRREVDAITRERDPLDFRS